MTAEEIIQGNKLIAEFMGYELYNGLFIHSESETPIGNTFYPDQSKYHSSWDWLMPVVEKMESKGFEVQIGRSLFVKNTNYCMIHDIGNAFCIEHEDVADKIIVVYRAVIEFIKWYNQNKTP